MSQPSRTIQRYALFIRTTPEHLWSAITSGDQTRRYFFGTRVSSTFEPGAPMLYALPDGKVAVDGEVVEAVHAKRLIHTWIVQYDPELAKERSRVSWQIEARGDACKLTVEHDVTDAPRVAAHVEKEGWSVVLYGLKTWLETGEELRIGEASAEAALKRAG